MTFETIIGLEIHLRLATATKLFCACPVEGPGGPNTKICPVCLGLPGTLPVLNGRAVGLGLRLAAALEATPAPVSLFARKQYVYPDLPRNYQITQLDPPLATGGRIEGLTADGLWAVPLTRLHLEEDAARLEHRSDGPSGVDFDRAGAPLAEIVTAPFPGAGAEAERCVRALQRLARWIGVSAARMEAGELRCDANISIRPAGSLGLGPRVELKNMNSARGVRLAVDHEAARQAGIVASGETVEEETRTWDPVRRRTVTLRRKEDEPDYRYLPEPDLPPLRPDPASIQQDLPELPWRRELRFRDELGLDPERAAAATAHRAVADFLEEVVAAGAAPRAAANLLWGAAAAVANERGVDLAEPDWSIEHLAGLANLTASGDLPVRHAADLLLTSLDEGADPVEEAGRLGLLVEHDDARLEAWVDEAVAAAPDEAEACRAGRTALLGWFVGRVVELSGGRADPRRAAALLRDRLAPP